MSANGCVLLLVLLPLAPAGASPYLDAAEKACRGRRFSRAAGYLVRSRSTDAFRRACLEAVVRSGLGRPLEALRFASRALELDPGSSRALGLRIRILLKLRRPREALAPLITLLFLQPKNGYAHGLAAAVFEALGRYGESLAHCRRSLAGGKVDGWGYYRMGRLLERLGRHQQALYWYRRARMAGIRPRRGWGFPMARCIWRTGLADKQAGRLEAARASFLLLSGHFGQTPYGRAAREQLAALKRLAAWQQNGKKRGNK